MNKWRKISFQRVLTLMLVCMFGGLPGGIHGVHGAKADTGPWQGNEYFEARLISAVTATGEAPSLEAGLEFRLSPGWKVYWRSPGDAGLPPELDFTGSGAVAGHHLSFPAPTRFSILGFDSYGYSDAVILPLRLDLVRAGRDLVVAAGLEGLVCSDICIPVQEVLTLSVPAGEAKPSSHARRMAEFRSSVPSAGTAGGVSLRGVAIDGEGLSLALERVGQPLTRLDGDIFIEAASGYGFTSPQFSGGLARIGVSGKPAADLAGNPVTITVVGRDFLLEATSVVAGEPLKPTSIMPALLAMLGVAFIGGVILNVMPCVLPVLTLKLSSVMGHGGGEAMAIRRSFIATAAGVIVSFIILGAALLLARSAGLAVGWGIQFQQPAFLILAAAAIGFFGLVMLDIVTLPVPQFARRLGGSQASSGLAGDFASGALATLLATPCSAPFVGTAIAFALAAPGGMLMTVFLSMGAGLALPWVMVAAFPALVRYLPKPGPWLITMKRVLALGLFATSVWLLTVLGSHFNSSAGPDQGWQEWQPGLAQSLTAEGRVVFVDVTADWCITCKTNKALVLDTDTVSKTFADQDVVLLRADWTLPDDAISAYLASFGRYGIPFNAVYGLSAPDGLPLPEILTTSAIRDALQRASGPPLH